MPGQWGCFTKSNSSLNTFCENLQRPPASSQLLWIKYFHHALMLFQNFLGSDDIRGHVFWENKQTKPKQRRKQKDTTKIITYNNDN